MSAASRNGRLYPFFSYYGAKNRAAPLYPNPSHRLLIEPFAGSAGYSVLHHEHDVILGDLDHRIVGVWSYLIRAKESEILSLPVQFEHVNDLHVPQEAKWFLGFWIVKGASYPRLTPANWQKSGKYPSSIWSEVVRARIASQVGKIRHWQVHCRSYEEMPNVQASWFIDPPYVGRVGRHYLHHHIDRCNLGAWCLSREGQTIVCGADGEDWLPFESLATVPSMATRHGRRFSHEAVWIRQV